MLPILTGTGLKDVDAASKVFEFPKAIPPNLQAILEILK
jgi:hypothetical protein